jgi:hypothetical protein
MEQFITLRQFCLLKDPNDRKDMPPRDLRPGNGAYLPGCDRRGWWHGRDVVARYDLAKESWERFGDAGPPPGTRVVSLGDGRYYVLEGAYPGDDRFFAAKEVGSKDDRRMLVDKAVWWALIIPADHPFCTERRPWLRWEHAIG